jgi:hypothetical protein
VVGGMGEALLSGQPEAGHAAGIESLPSMFGILACYAVGSLQSIKQPCASTVAG